MSDLTEFLLARIAEDEERAALPPVRQLTEDVDITSRMILDGRLWRECEAKRRIVERAAEQIQAAQTIRDIDWPDESREAIERAGYNQTASLSQETLRAIATVYADHPDYREEWRP